MAGSYMWRCCVLVKRIKHVCQLEWCPKITIQEYWHGGACLYPSVEEEANLIYIGKTLPPNNSTAATDDDDDIIVKKDEL